MSLQGNLVDLPLIDLVQVLTLQNKTGVLSISRDFSQAQVAFGKSRIYSAFVHHNEQNGHPVYKQGEDALYDLLEWPDGQFTFELTNALPNVENVQQKWDYMILEHCRRHDELEQKQRQGELLSSRPRLIPNPPAQAEITLDLEQWRILFQINGLLSLQEIATNTRQDPEEVVRIVGKLAKKGLIELDVAPLPPPVQDYAAYRQAQPHEAQHYSQVLPPRQEIEIYSRLPLPSQEAPVRSSYTAPQNTPNPNYGPTQATRSTAGASNRPTLPPAPRSYPSAVSQDFRAPNNRVTEAAQAFRSKSESAVTRADSNAKEQVPTSAPSPKVQRGVLSGIMAKIRGL